MDKSRFDLLCDQWVEGYQGSTLSDPEAMEIISAGHQVLPWIFNRIMFDDRGLWWHLFAAKITGENPVPKPWVGMPPVAKAYWIAWGISNGYLTQATYSSEGCKTKFSTRKKPGPKPKGNQ